MSATKNERLNTHSLTHSMGMLICLIGTAFEKRLKKNTELYAETKTNTELIFRTYRHRGCSYVIKFDSIYTVVSVAAMLWGKLIRIVIGK